ncbi:leucine-rich repeat-containing protein 74B-like isoform X1 [Dreissena polymorpha]|uniref:leucine-rich repeat-containing protein 74B-like isoform X1 n=2 Tax=Dreissena polymorpha TaxID=45954 RepID=UPI002263FAF2|nr:leucine-rich repeat-containing protein 74B-like isoform X1 [Dreissena polymorpha]
MADGFDGSSTWKLEHGQVRLINIDRMPIHHKALDKRRVSRRKKSPTEETRKRSKMLTKLTRGASKADLKSEPPARPTTPKYLKDYFDYDKNSSSEESASDEDKTKEPAKTLDMSQKIYLTACIKEGVAPRRRLLKGLTQDGLNVNNCTLAPSDIKALAYALTTNMCVTSLDLSGNEIGREGMEYLVEMLEENMTVTELRLSNARLGLYEVLLLTEMLSENMRITTLQVAGNDLDDECAKCFAEALKYNRKIKKLNLSHNKFNETGGKILAKSIETNDSIEDLDMSWNSIRMLGAIAWGDTLYNNVDLKHLNLSWNGFGDEGAASIGEALEENNTLLTLDLSCNRIGFEGSRAIAKALGNNSSLESLALSQNQVTTQGAVELLTHLQINDKSKLQELLLEGTQVTSEADDLYEEIRGVRSEFKFVHGGHVISPDTLAFKTVKPEEKNCRSSKS